MGGVPHGARVGVVPGVIQRHPLRRRAIALRLLCLDLILDESQHVLVAERARLVGPEDRVKEVQGLEHQAETALFRVVTSKWKTSRKFNSRLG